MTARHAPPVRDHRELSAVREALVASVIEWFNTAAIDGGSLDTGTPETVAGELVDEAILPTIPAAALSTPEPRAEGWPHGFHVQTKTEHHGRDISKAALHESAQQLRDFINARPGEENPCRFEDPDHWLCVLARTEARLDEAGGAVAFDDCLPDRPASPQPQPEVTEFDAAPRLIDAEFGGRKKVAA